MRRLIRTIPLALLFLLIISSLCFGAPSEDIDCNQNPLPDECKLDIGTNLGGLSDWGTEIPFVDLMRSSREWFTKSVGDPSTPWNSEKAEFLSYRSDGYPTHCPQTISESEFPQQVATIWARTNGWPSGTYTVYWEGTGTLQFVGVIQNLQQINAHHMTFDLATPGEGAIEMRILSSEITDPVRNIRVLMPGTENSYTAQPFNQVWVDKLAPFKTVRFMDWGNTNNWAGVLPREDTPRLYDWAERSHYDYYTWTTPKGVPYEIMVQLLNQYDIDGWICVPHNASSDYILKMAEFFRDNLEPGRHLYVEYSNEIWNWMFEQTQWLNDYGCTRQGISWPEGIVPYIQNCMTIWTSVYTGQLDRITRVVGTHLAWLDVSQRITRNVISDTFDAISPTYYFGLSSEDDATLDALGASATVSDLAAMVRADMPRNFGFIQNNKELADELNKRLIFYEGGQHLTPHPFGVEPTYAQVLLDIQRDPLMYDLYTEWFDLIRTIQDVEAPLLLMNFSFIGGRSARYGSWGILETMDQDINLIPAPKYQAVLDNMAHYSTSPTPGDVSGNSTINLEDVILSLMIASGYDAGAIGTISMAGDINGDARIGLEDTMGILRSITDVVVENLNDSGNGSLRAAVASNANTITFDVAGDIHLESELIVDRPVLIDGKGLITIKNEQIRITSSDVTLRNLRIRLTNQHANGVDQTIEEADKRDALKIVGDVTNVNLESISVSDSTDETISISGDVGTVSIANSIIGKPLNFSNHPKGEHGYCMLVENTKRLVLENNLFAHCARRSPRMDGGELIYNNNIVYNPGQYIVHSHMPIRADFVNNYVIFPSVENRWQGTSPVFQFFANRGSASTVYFQDNHIGNLTENGNCDGEDSKVAVENGNCKGGEMSNTVINPQFGTYATRTEQEILNMVGAMPLDGIDSEIIREVIERTGTYK